MHRPGQETGQAPQIVRIRDLARVEGGWSAILRAPALEPGDDLALRILRDAGVLIHPGHFFDLPGDGYLVCSLLPAEFPEGIARVAEILEGVRPE
ncbi:MAG: hypothetical protein HGA66_00630 [Holophaga sp.]|nr:hypothetical protein [Holophaga sp.]